MRRSHVIVSLLLVVGVFVGWLFVNPAAAFGISRYGLTTFNRVPIPAADLQVRSDGETRWVWKRHILDDSTLAWPLSRPASVLIIGRGWRDGVRPPQLSLPPGTELLFLPSGEALREYNALKARGISVAIHFHSTC